MTPAQNPDYKPRKWYTASRFPLLPVITHRRPDKHNSRNISVQWLFLQLWTLDHVAFEFSFVCSAHWGIGFIGILPYLRWCLCIPIPEKAGFAIDRFFNRAPKHHYYQTQHEEVEA